MPTRSFIGQRLTMRWRFFGTFAAEIAFYFVLALVPFLIVTFAVASFAIPRDLHVTDQIGEIIGHMLPPGVDIDIGAMLDHARTSASGGWLTFGFLLAIWTSFRFMDACVQALHFIARDQGEPGPALWKRVLWAILLLVVWMLALVLMALFFILAVPIEKFLGGHGLVSVVSLKVWAMTRAGVTVGLLFGAFYLTYHTISPRHLAPHGALQAALLASLGWFGLSIGFSYILPTFWRNYHEVYGALGSLIAFLLWAQLNAWVVILAGCWMIRDHPGSG